MPPYQPHWLTRYSTNHHAWTCTPTSFRRPLGLVETSFDSDGTYYGGRADMTATLHLAVQHTLSPHDLRKRIVLAWTAVRLHHVLLMSRVADDASTGRRDFVVDVPRSAAAAVRDVEASMIWLDDLGYDENVDDAELHTHALNVARIVEPGTCMSKVHVLPLRKNADGTYALRFLIIMGHQISDGLSAYNWFGHFIRLLNAPLGTIEEDVETAVRADQLKSRLPPAQEDLYPRVTGNKARQRWFWAIVRVLRHVQKTMPPTFVNPLRREKRLDKALAFPPTYSNIFDYSEERRPPLSSGTISATLSRAASERLVALCRSANVSIGAGCFALAGISMMDIHEARYTSIPAAQRPSFGASFPLNPRAFLGVKPEADSCMLAFSEGIVMPFLPSDLPIEGRFRLVAKHANRELRVYQKRFKDKGGATSVLDKNSPRRWLATGYLAHIERVDAKSPVERRSGQNPQGDLKPNAGQYGATCGVSSVGSLTAFFRPGTYDLATLNGTDFAADYRGLRIGVRARDNEFLIASSTGPEGLLGFGVSYDMNAISPEAAENWSRTIRGLLE